MSFCKYCGYDVAGPCESARLAARCQSLRSTCEFCGHDLHLPCDDAEAAGNCRMQYVIRREERLSGYRTGLR